MPGRYPHPSRRTVRRVSALSAGEEVVDDLRQPAQWAAPHRLDLDDASVREAERDAGDETVAHGDDLGDLFEVDRARISRRRRGPRTSDGRTARAGRWPRPPCRRGRSGTRTPPPRRATRGTRAGACGRNRARTSARVVTAAAPRKLARATASSSSPGSRSSSPARGTVKRARAPCPCRARPRSTS